MRANRTAILLALSLVVLLSVAVYGLFRLSVAPTTSGRDVRAPAGTAAVNSSKMSTTTAAAAADKRQMETRQVPTKDELRTSFLKSQQCYYASRELAATKNVADCKRLEGNPRYERQYAACLSKWVDAHERMSNAQAAMAGCGNEGDSLKSYYDATKAAARNGDPDAQLCYLDSDFSDSEGMTHYSDSDTEEYRAVAPQYVANAFNRGDWRIVYLLSTRQLDRQSGLKGYLEDIGQPETVYKMERLLRLGASGDYATDLDGFMDALAHPKPEGGLPQSKIAEADAWAKQTYTEHFAGEPGLTKAPTVCGPDVPLLTY